MVEKWEVTLSRSFASGLVLMIMLLIINVILYYIKKKNQCIVEKDDTMLRI